MWQERDSSTYSLKLPQAHVTMCTMAAPSHIYPPDFLMLSRTLPLRSRRLFNLWVKARSPFTSSWIIVFGSRSCFLCWFGWRCCIRSVEIFLQMSRTCSHRLSYSLARQFLNTMSSQWWIERALDWRRSLTLFCDAQHSSSNHLLEHQTCVDGDGR